MYDFFSYNWKHKKKIQTFFLGDGGNTISIIDIWLDIIKGGVSNERYETFL